MYTDPTQDLNKLFDDATDVLLDLMGKARNKRLKEVYDLAIKATEYYREYLEQNRPYDYTTSTYTASSPAFLPYKKDSIVIPKQAITNWEVQDCNGIRHSKVEFLDHIANYGGGFL